MCRRDCHKKTNNINTCNNRCSCKIRWDIDLNYIEKGRCNNQVILLVHGWLQSSKIFQGQLDGLSNQYHVIAVDMRGHGDSPKPPTGYRVAQLADDLHRFIVKHRLKNIILGGHSMGASIIWSYIERFGSYRISKFIFIDSSPAILNSFRVTDEDEKKKAGFLFTDQDLYDVTSKLLTNQAGVIDDFRPTFFSEDISEELVQFNKSESLKVPSEYAAKLLIDLCTQDLRDIIKNIIPKLHKPVLVFGGDISLFPKEVAIWMADQIPNSRLEIFSASEKGSHFMFLENPNKFNRVVRNFVR